MKAYAPQLGLYPGRPPCATCGADFHLHRPAAGAVGGLLPGGRITGRGLATLAEAGVALWCPEPYRPASMAEAQRLLEEAERSGDQARVFVARGELQRLEGRHPRD